MSTATPHPNERNVLDRLTPVWVLFFYSSMGLSLLGLTADPAAGLLSWRGATIAALCGLSVLLFHGLFARRYALNPGSWPHPPALAWSYLGGQALLLAGLLALDRSFVAMVLVMPGQIMGSLRPRHWPLPLAVFFGLASYGVGLFEGEGITWAGVAGFAFSMLLIVVGGLMIHQLFSQRYRLLHLVGELRQAKAELEAATAEREELAALRERARLAREVHDSLGHALVLVNVKLEAAQRLYARDRGRGDAELEATRELVRDTMGELRGSLASLRAPLGELEPLPQALAKLAEAANARGSTRVQTALPDASVELSPAAAEALRKIAREALANVERHAGARRAWLELTSSDGGWLLRVSDDGRGVRSGDLRKPGHFGVVGMGEYAENAGGRLTVGARPGGGTLVEAWVPEG
jgi:signal transduction histidine kinase